MLLALTTSRLNVKVNRNSYKDVKKQTRELVYVNYPKKKMTFRTIPNISKQFNKHSFVPQNRVLGYLVIRPQ